VERGEFRGDLFYRLNVMPIHLPPLRERSSEDVAELAQRIFEDLAREAPGTVDSISAETLERLTYYRWPGNVRELRNILERARILAGDSTTLLPSHLPPELQAGNSRLPATEGELVDLTQLEQRHIRRVLRHCEGNRTRAARVLGITRATLHNKINKYGLEKVGLEAD